MEENEEIKQAATAQKKLKWRNEKLKNKIVALASKKSYQSTEDIQLPDKKDDKQSMNYLRKRA